jgi:hypothetical protein
MRGMRGRNERRKQKKKNRIEVDDGKKKNEKRV